MPWVCNVSTAGIHQILTRLNISYKRARASVRSSKLDYTQKIDRLQHVLEETRQHPQTFVALYPDVTTLYKYVTDLSDTR